MRHSNGHGPAGLAAWARAERHYAAVAAARAAIAKVEEYCQCEGGAVGRSPEYHCMRCGKRIPYRVKFEGAKE